MAAVVEITPEPKARGREVAKVATSPLDIVQAALKSGNVEMYREAVALMKEMDAFAARKAFNNALADAKAELPIIKKNSHVSFENAKGDETSYWHEDLAEVVDTVAPILSRHGLSHRFRLKGKPGEPVTVTCIISHRDGFCEENELSAGADTSGGKNAIQGVKSAVSYLERITLMASLGLASRRDDDDGRGTSAQTAQPEAYAPPPGSITQDQADQIRDGLEAKGASRKAFLQWAKQRRIEDIPAEHFDACMAAIAKFRKV
ncbi:ERF family protein [Bradyrhizobium sp.]|uniref:ERF family protein n=1 Tax=Bradyrhizobium sp. TaxID=376 RepID=UPI003C3C471F